MKEKIFQFCSFLLMLVLCAIMVSELNAPFIVLLSLAGVLIAISNMTLIAYWFFENVTIKQNSEVQEEPN